ARVQDQVMEDRWQRAQRHEAIAANQQQTAFMNRRFATVVPAEDFAHSRPVARVALQVAPDRLAAAPVAPVAAPPAPTQSIRAVQAPANAPAAAPNARAPNAPAPAAPAPAAQAPAAQAGPARAAANATVPAAQPLLSNRQAIGGPEPTAANQPKAPGPQIATTRPNEPNAPNAARPGLPPLAPRTGAAPPQPGQPAPANAAKPADAKPTDNP